jgi:hypothetical protein
MRERFPDRLEAAYESERRYLRLDPPKIETLKRLREKGVSVDALCEPELIARAEVVFLPDRPGFDFAVDVGGDDGVSACIFLARDDLGEPCDLVAWEPQARRLAAWYGSAALLGAENIYGPRLDRENTLSVFETPFEWLLNDRDGVVIIDPLCAGPVLFAASPLRASSRSYGRRLRDVVNPPSPRIYVPKTSSRAAA